MGIYTPNGGKESFFKELRDKIKYLNYDQTIMMGDFNGVMNPLWDRSTTNKKSKNSEGKLPKIFFELLEKESLTDIWNA